MKKMLPLFLTLFLTGIVSADSFIQKWGIGTDQVFSLVLLKYFLLIMLFALIYMSLSFMKFFENAPTRIVLALVVSILISIAINPNDIVAALALYKSLYVTIVLFVPFLVIGTLTLKALERFDTFGIFIQKVLWGIYSIYLLFVSAGMLLFSNSFLEGLNKIFPFNYLWTYLFKYVWMFYEFFGLLEENNAIGFLLLIVSLFIIYTLVLNNESTTKILRDWIKDAKKLKERDTAAKLNAARNIMAKNVDNA